MRRRLVLAIALVAAASVLLFALPLGVAVTRLERDQELLRLQRDTIAATRQIDLSTPRADQVELPHSSDRLTVFDRAGRVVVGVRAPAGDLIARAVRGAHPVDGVRDGRLQVAVPLLTGEQVSGVLLASRSQSAALARAHRVWLILFALGAAIVALATLAALLLARRLARPFERVADAAGRLGDGDFSTRAPRTGVPEADEIAAALDTTATRLDTLVTRERAFSADASHQLRTPLAALRIEIEGLVLTQGEDPSLISALAQIDRLEATVDTLLTVARDLPRTRAITDLGALLRAADERWRGPLAAVGRTLHVSIALDDVATSAAAPVLDVVLDVLLENALQHGAGPVTLALRETSGWLAIDVEDEGAGVVGDTKAIFARRVGAGSGIGLDLARSLTAGEGGRLDLTRPQPGARFSVLLPRVVGEHVT